MAHFEAKPHDKRLRYQLKCNLKLPSQMSPLQVNLFQMVSEPFIKRFWFIMIMVGNLGIPTIVLIDSIASNEY